MIPRVRCSKCPKVRGRYPIPSVGPVPCPVLLLGEGPSYKEDELNTPFVGPTGRELDHLYLMLAGLPRSSVHIYNARCCSSEDYANPTIQQAIACSKTHLGPLLHEVQPIIVVPMGNVACALFHQVDLNLHHGTPQVGRWSGWEGIIFPMYHPAAGMKPGGSGYMIALTQDFKRLGELVREMELL